MWSSAVHVQQVSVITVARVSMLCLFIVCVRPAGLDQDVGISSRIPIQVCYLSAFRRVFSSGAQSWNFGHVLNYLCLHGRKPENSSLLRWQNTKEVIINREGTRMVKDAGDLRSFATVCSC